MRFTAAFVMSTNMDVLKKVKEWLSFWVNNAQTEAKDEKSPEIKPLLPEDYLVDVDSCIKPGSGRVLKVMTVADGHGRLMERDLVQLFEQKGLPEVVFLLGDNFISDINSLLYLLPKGIPIYGIAGNHDAANLLSDYERITDLHCKTADLDGGIKVGALAGSIRYKPDPYFTMFTNEEALELMKDMPYCDILITHDKPCFTLPDTITSHSGLLGIGRYVLEKRPHIVLHGHLHEPYIKRLDNTIIKCCYGAEIFDVSF